MTLQCYWLVSHLFLIVSFVCPIVLWLSVIFGTGYLPGFGPGYPVRHIVSGFNTPVATIIHRITLTALGYCDFELPTKYEFSSTNETLLFVQFLIICDFAFFICIIFIFSERSRSLYDVTHPSVVCLSVCNARAPYSGGWNFGNISTTLGTLAMRWHPLKISQRSSQGNPSAGGVKHEG